MTADRSDRRRSVRVAIVARTTARTADRYSRDRQVSGGSVGSVTNSEQVSGLGSEPWSAVVLEQDRRVLQIER